MTGFVKRAWRSTEELIEIGPATPRVTLVNEFIGYPEHMAVVDDDIAALDAALAASDGDINIFDVDDQLTPLLLAICLHRTRIVEHLIGAGAELNLDDNAIHCASEFGNERSMALLLQASPDVRTSTESKYLCNLAAQNTDAGVLRLLLEAGAPAEEWDETNKRPIHWAAANENEQVMSLLLAAGCSMAFGRGRGPAGIAASNRNHKVLAMLIKAGANIAEMDLFGYLPIHLASYNPNSAVVRLLIDAGVDLNVLDRRGENAVFKACENTNIDVLDALLAAGAQWRDVARDRHIAHAVAGNSNEAIVRRVIARGVDLNAYDWNGATPLQVAAECGTVAVVSILLEAGADINATNAAGEKQESICFRACCNENVGVMRVLIAAGAPFDGDVMCSVINNSNVDALQALIDAGMNVSLELKANQRKVTCCSSKMCDLLFRHVANLRVFVADVTRCFRGSLLPVMFSYGVDFKNRRNPSYGVVKPVAHLTIFAAGGNGDFSYDDVVLGVGGHPDVIVPRRQLAWACHQVVVRQFKLLRPRAFQICVGLQSLRLPALVLCEILAHAFAPRELLVAFHRVWAIVTTIKHLREPCARF